MKIMKVVMTMTYQNHSLHQPTSIQYHQQLSHPSMPQIIKNQQYPPLHRPQNEDQWSSHFVKQSTDDC